MKLKKLWRQPPRSFKHRLKVGVLAPDGVPISVNWEKMTPGASLFIPCVNTLECVRQVYELGVDNDWTLDIRTVVNGGRWGVRIWRVL
jgi:hypothetical protein